MSLLFNRNFEKQNILIIEMKNSIIFLEFILHTNFQFPRFLNKCNAHRDRAKNKELACH